MAESAPPAVVLVHGGFVDGSGWDKVLIEVVDPEGRVLTAQTVTFKSPGK